MGLVFPLLFSVDVCVCAARSVVILVLVLVYIQQHVFVVAAVLLQTW